MRLLTELRKLTESPKEEPDERYSFPLASADPPCKAPSHAWDMCECHHWGKQRELWAEARDMAESDDVRELVISVIDDLDELLEGHDLNNEPPYQMDDGP